MKYFEKEKTRGKTPVLVGRVEVTWHWWLETDGTESKFVRSVLDKDTVESSGSSSELGFMAAYQLHIKSHLFSEGKWDRYEM